MSASKFIRNFLTKSSQRGPKKHSCNPPRGICNDDPKSEKTQDLHDVAHANGEQREYLDVPFVIVTFSQWIEKRNGNHLHRATLQEKTKNIRTEGEFPTASQEADFRFRGIGVGFITGRGCDAQKKDAHCGSNGFKPITMKDEGVEEHTFGATIGEINFTSTQSTYGAISEDYRLDCNFNPTCDTGDEESLKFVSIREQCLSDIENTMITAEYLSQTTEVGDRQHKRTSENIDTLTHEILSKHTAGIPATTMDSSSKTRYEADDECISIASLNTDIYEENDYQDIKMHEQETREPINDSAVTDLAASVEGSDHQLTHSNIQVRKESSRYEPLKVLLNSCSICKKVFSLPSILKLHMMFHLDEITLKQTFRDYQFYPMTQLLLNPLRSTNSELVEGLDRSDNVGHKEVLECEKAIVGEPQIKNTMETCQNETKDNPLKVVNGERFSVASGIVYEDKISSLESSQCSTGRQTFHSSNRLTTLKVAPLLFSGQTAMDKEKPFEDEGSSPESSQCSTTDHEYSSSEEEVPASIRHQSYNIRDTSASRLKMSMSLPSGSTSVSDRGLVRIENKETPFACGLCGKAYKLRSSVYGHIRLQHGEKRYACEFCGKRYARPSDLAKHVVVHSQEKPFTCDQCGKCYRRKAGLCNHKRTHSDERPFQCKKCNKSFKFKNILTRHLESHDKDEERKGVLCSVCNKKFRTRSDLRLHTMIHSGETPFKCTLCEKQFRLNTELTKHMNVHRGQKTVADKQCPVCNKTVSGSYMSIHMRMHSGVKPFECSVCGKRFPKKTNLEGHMRSHTGEKPFACSECDKQFALYSNMMTHKAKCKELSDKETKSGEFQSDFSFATETR